MTQAAPLAPGSTPLPRAGSAPLAAGINPLAQALLPDSPSGHAVDAAALQAVSRLPGPAGALLQQGASPDAALAAQRAWEGAVLGTPLPMGTPIGAPGQAAGFTEPVWQRWGLNGARALDALVLGVTGASAGLAELAAAAQRPSQTAATLLGLGSAAVPAAALDAVLARMDPRQVEAALLGLANKDGTPGLNGLVRLAGMPATLEGALGLVLAGNPAAPLLLAMLGSATPAAPGDAPGVAPGVTPGVTLGGGLVLHAAAAAGDLPAMAAIAWPGPAPGSAGLAGTLLGRAGEAVLAAMAGAAPGSVVAGLVLHLPLDSAGAVRGTLNLVDGSALEIEAEDDALPPGALSGNPALGIGAVPHARASAVLALGNGMAGNGRTEVLGPHVRFEDPKAVPLDIHPVKPEAAAWRVDDTGVSAALGADGIDAALHRARTLYRKLMAGKLTLDQVPPGHGIDTWDGSPAWLALAGVAKPAGLGVAPGEASPPRLDLVRAGDGQWVVKRRGGSDGRDSTRTHPPDAAESIALFHDAVFGLDPDTADAPPGGAAGGLALRGFRRARAGMAADWQAAATGDAAERARGQEAWGAVARLWAGALERMRRAGTAGRLSSQGVPAAQAAALRELAAWCGPVTAWHAAHAAGLDCGTLLRACDDPARDGLARSVAPAAALACLLGEPVHGTADGGWPAAQRLLAGGLADDLVAWGDAALADVAEGRPDTLGWGDALALLARLGRLRQAG